MEKVLIDNKAVFCTEHADEAIDFLEGLKAKIKLFEYKGRLYEAKNITDIIITIQLQGEFEEKTIEV